MKWIIREMRTELTTFKESCVYKSIMILDEDTMDILQIFNIVLNAYAPSMFIECEEKPNNFPTFNHIFADKMKDIAGMKQRRYKWYIKGIKISNCIEFYEEFEKFFKELIEESMREAYGKEEDE